MSGAPLNLWTIPNAIGIVRLGLLPIFLIVSFSSDSGIGVWPAVLFGVAGWTDYFDGIAARPHGPVQPLRDASGPRGQPCAGPLRRHRLLVPRPVAARALDSSSGASCSCSSPGAL